MAPGACQRTARVPADPGMLQARLWMQTSDSRKKSTGLSRIAQLHLHELLQLAVGLHQLRQMPAQGG